MSEAALSRDGKPVNLVSLASAGAAPVRQVADPAGVRRLADVLAAGHFAVTGEIVPPASADPWDFVARAAPLKGWVDAANVTDAAGARATMCSLAGAALLVQNGIDAVLQMTCRDRNRIALEGDLLGAAALDVRNVLMMTGDDPKGGDQPETKAVHDIDSRALMNIARVMRDEGVLPSGRAIAGRPQVFIGCAEVPSEPKPDWQPKGILAKIEAGARFAQTQFCFDAGVARRWAARLVDAGIAEKLYVLIGIGPIASVKSAVWMRDNLWGTVMPDSVIARLEQATDARAEGVRICAELMQELAEVPGIAGVHLMSPRGAETIAEAVAESGIMARRGAARA
ncbi:MAG: methylenetetrahydrofolate reductase [Alphaproteobacteria bacterium]